MLNWLRRRAYQFITSAVYREVVVGGNCGLCGKWIEHELVPRDWPWSVCANCAGVPKPGGEDVNLVFGVKKGVD